MAKLVRTFTGGVMNKDLDERLVPDGQYIHAENVWPGSVTNQNTGSLENSKGNSQLTTLTYVATPLSDQATTIGSYSDSATNTMYWFVHDPAYDNQIAPSPTGKCDMIVSMNMNTGVLTYHVVSCYNQFALPALETTLNFNPQYLITGINLIQNLLFFTDDYNEPRFIDVTKNYIKVPPPIADLITTEEFLVIKRPPNEAPEITLVNVGDENNENYLKEKFICFAYRYKYANNEYSATSQWSLPAFAPNAFEFTTESYLNEGMQNEFNGVQVTYNSGGPLVVGIDLLFKEADSNVVKVIEKINKQEQGLINSTDYTFLFTNAKIFTVLPSAQLLRLYDSVPLLAKAQTIMGNRLMYGNYLEGYPLRIPGEGGAKDYNLRLTYFTDLLSEPVTEDILTTALDTGDYEIDPGLGVQSIADSIISIDLDGFDLTSGSAISFDITLSHDSFTGTALTETNAPFTLQFTYVLPTTYATVYDLVTSVGFQNAITTLSPLIDACDGTSLTDQNNCLPAPTLDDYHLYSSGITANDQSIIASATVGGTTIDIQVLALVYANDAEDTFSYEYLKATSVSASYQKIFTTRSLHSNRGYEVGIVYMDEYKRATTALTSLNNTVFVPCQFSKNQNRVQVTIPPSQVPPPWAKSYKFVMKPDALGFFTVYTFFYFADPNSNAYYYLLDGENSAKVEKGDRLIVKADSTGPVGGCVYATVLDKTSEAADFIAVSGLYIPQGVYMRIEPANFNSDIDLDAVINPGWRNTWVGAVSGLFPYLPYPVRTLTPPSTWNDYTIPVGSRILIDVEWQRDQTLFCDERKYTFKKEFISQADYDDFQAWFEGDGIYESNVLNGEAFTILSGPTVTNVYAGSLGTPPYPGAEDTNYWFFVDVGVGDPKNLVISGPNACPGGIGPNSRRSEIHARIVVYRAENMIVFETEPDPALPDVFFENNESFEIFGGNHLCNVTNQDIASNTSGVSILSFFNCFAFGNGVESERIRDSIKGERLTLGNRVTTVAEVNYGQVRRFADITYSGIYNNENGLNGFNEFNQGLFNWKVCEASFGAIQILDSMQTNVLVFQTDKISYVLTEKNLLSDSVGGGVITSVPEVLGTQIARNEEYGISEDPASYIQWGQSRYFTDSKRGVVLRLDGDNINQALTVISEQGLETYFRDTFIATIGRQKLGAYDPFMDVYTLAINNRDLPGEDTCINCGLTQTVTIPANGTFSFCSIVESTVGTVDVVWTVSDGGSGFVVDTVYNEVEQTSGTVTVGGTIEVVKDNNAVNTIATTVTAGDEPVTISITVGCVEADSLTVVLVCLSDNVDATKFIHNNYEYNTVDFDGPLQSTQIQLASGTNSPLVSQYTTYVGVQGQGAFPTDGSDVTLYCQKVGVDNFVFNQNFNRFRYLRSNTLYENNATDINALITASITASPIDDSGALAVYSATFEMPVSGDYLYLIWDYRTPTAAFLCSEATADAACCDCTPCDETCNEYTITNAGDGSLVYSYIACNGTPVSVTLGEGESRTFCAQPTPTIVSGHGTVTLDDCQCPT